jgi:hypothetical protein
LPVDQAMCAQGNPLGRGRRSPLRAVSGSLREQGKDGSARAADKLAEYVENVGGYLHEKDEGALLSDVEDLGRRQPLAAGAGALALVFADSRFLKASSSKRYSSRPRTSQAPTRSTSAAPFTPASPASSLPPEPATAPPSRHLIWRRRSSRPSARRPLRCLTLGRGHE